MCKVTHFEIPADDVERSRAFYKNVLAWEANRWEGLVDYSLVGSDDENEVGINGGLMARQHPGQPVFCTESVVDFDTWVERIGSSGGEIVVPKSAIPSVGWLACFKDPEGNVFGAMQSDRPAAQ